MKKDKNQVVEAIGTASTIGFYLVSSVIVGVYLGRLIDNYFNIAPWATVIGIILGMIAGMWATYKRVVGK